MESNEAPTPEACCLEIYGREKDAGFKMLKSRLKEKVFDFLVTDISADKLKELDEMDYMAIKIKKKSILFHQLYYSKNRLPLLYDLLDEIITLAKEYEYYLALIEHLKWKKNLVGWKKSKEDFEIIEKEIEYYLELNHMMIQSEKRYRELVILSEYSGNQNKEKTFSLLVKAIPELKGYYKRTRSPRIKYCLKFLELEFYQLRKNYLKAHKVCLELLDAVRNNKSIYRRERVSIIYGNLSRCEYYLNHYKQAANYSREAQKNATLNSENHCISIEQEFYAVFALKKYDEALELANKMLTSSTKKELGDFRHAKYNFLLANALFKLGRYKEVISILSKGLEISKDKAGWEIGIRVLTIMAYMEMEKPDEASFCIERLRKFIAFTDKKTPVSVRDKTILRLLQLMEKDGHPISAPLSSGRGDGGEAKNLLSKLGEWEPFTHEVIPFHKWVEGKVQNTFP